MKVSPVTLFVVFLLFALTVSFRTLGQSSNNVANPTVKERIIPAFHALQVSGLAVVYLARTGNTHQVKLVVSGISPEDVITTVKEGVLTVTTLGTHHGEHIQVYVSSPSVKSITVSGSGILYS